MKINTFITLLFQRKIGAITFISSDRKINKAWDKINKKINNINFGCNFKKDKDGLVKCSGEFSPSCCIECAYSIGFLEHIEVNNLKIYAKLFDKINGFLDYEKGCKLPIELRSSVCKGFCCSYISHNLSFKEKQFLKQLRRLDEDISENGYKELYTFWNKISNY